MHLLKRDLGKFSAYATIVGILIGAGVFRVTGEAGAIAGSAVPFAYLLSVSYTHLTLPTIYSV